MDPASPLLPADPAARGPGHRTDPTLPLAGVIGAELARHTSAMQQVLDETRQLRRLSRTHAAVLRQAVASAHRIAMDSQQIGRLAGGGLQQAPERRSLDAQVRAALQALQVPFDAAGVDLQSSLQPVEVVVDPALLASLVDAALGWCADRGHRLQVWLRVRGWPGHALLTLRSSQPLADAEAAGSETLQWHLLLQLARAMDVTLDRSDVGGESILTMEFPATVDEAAAAPANGSRPLAGCRLLLLTADAAVQADVEAVCASMGLLLAQVADAEAVAQACRQERPHLVLVDERLRGPGLEALRLDLLREGTPLPFVELASASQVLELAGWSGDALSRVSRDALRSQLPGILVMELARTV